MKNLHALTGLYAITDPDLLGDDLLCKTEEAIHAGINILQYRNKQASHAQQKKEALALLTLCRNNNVVFIVNDNVKLALEVDADGVHIGQQDSDISSARKQLGINKIIGVTCNNKIENAIHAQQQGADYVAFGRFFPSATKPSAPGADLSLLTNIRNEIKIPIVAIGGITHENAMQILAYDIDMIAVIAAIFAEPNIAEATRRFVDIIQSHSPRTYG